MIDNIRNEEIRARTGVTTRSEKIREARLRRLGLWRERQKKL